MANLEAGDSRDSQRCRTENRMLHARNACGGEARETGPKVSRKLSARVRGIRLGKLKLGFLRSVQQRLSELVFLALGLLGITLFGACSVLMWNDKMFPYCETDAAMELMAQSVPSASFVPCVRQVFAGWEFESVYYSDRGARLRFSSDLGGDDALIVNFSGSCPEAGVGVAVSEAGSLGQGGREGAVFPRGVPEEKEQDPLGVVVRPQKTRSDLYESSDFYVFRGGCVELAMRFFGEGVGERLALEAGRMIDVQKRSEVARELRQRYGDTVRLDPEPAPAPASEPDGSDRG